MVAVFTGFDFVAASSTPPVSVSVSAVGGGWEIDAAAFATKQSSVPLLELWLETITSQWQSRRMGELVSGDQQGEYMIPALIIVNICVISNIFLAMLLDAALMLALETSKYRVYPLPALFNFHSASVYPRHGPPIPVVVQTKVFADPRADLNNIRDVAAHVAMVMMEDCLNNMKRVNKAG